MILNKTIKIDNIESKFASTGNEGITLISGKDKYTFYRTVKGQDGEVYKAFKNMDVKPNDIVNIGYTEEDQEFTNEQGKLIKFKKRSVVGIREGNATQLSIPENRPLSVANNAPHSQSDDQYWDKKAYKQCLWNYWLEAHGNIVELKGLSDAEKDCVWNVFKQIEQDADMRFATGMEKARAIFKKDEPLPEEQSAVNIGDEFLPNEPKDIYNTKQIPF